jgi:hypothetical protein
MGVSEEDDGSHEGVGKGEKKGKGSELQWGKVEGKAKT